MEQLINHGLIDHIHHQHTLDENTRIRRLTPLETERLQGFPDGHTEGVSDTQRYKQMGNSMTVQVMEHVLGEIIGEYFEIDKNA